MAMISGFESIGVDSLTPHIGAQISGVDLSQDLSNEQFSEIYQAWLDWKVIVFRDQDIDRDQHKAFARKFGTLHVHPNAAQLWRRPRNPFGQNHQKLRLYCGQRMAHRCYLRRNPTHGLGSLHKRNARKWRRRHVICKHVLGLRPAQRHHERSAWQPYGNTRRRITLSR